LKRHAIASVRGRLCTSPRCLLEKQTNTHWKTSIYESVCVNFSACKKSVAAEREETQQQT
jgi:hypothetical protein